MKKTTMLGAVIVLAAVAGATLARKDASEPERLSKFMRAKLVHSQKVLEGLTTENMDLVAKHSQDMTLLSQDASWRVLMTREYAQRSTDFRRATMTLTKEAKNKNLDGATLAYLDITLKCVECHKYVRSVRQVNWAPKTKSKKLVSVLAEPTFLISSPTDSR